MRRLLLRCVGPWASLHVPDPSAERRLAADLTLMTMMVMMLMLHIQHLPLQRLRLRKFPLLKLRFPLLQLRLM